MQVLIFSMYPNYENCGARQLKRYSKMLVPKMEKLDAVLGLKTSYIQRDTDDYGRTKAGMDGWMDGSRIYGYTDPCYTNIYADLKYIQYT